MPKNISMIQCFFIKWRMHFLKSIISFKWYSFLRSVKQKLPNSNLVGKRGISKAIPFHPSLTMTNVRCSVSASETGPFLDVIWLGAWVQYDYPERWLGLPWTSELIWKLSVEWGLLSAVPHAKSTLRSLSNNGGDSFCLSYGFDRFWQQYCLICGSTRVSSEKWYERLFNSRASQFHY